MLALRTRRVYFTPPSSRKLGGGAGRRAREMDRVGVSVWFPGSPRLVTRKGGREGWPYTLHVTVLERNKSLRPVECLMEWAGSRFCREARRSCERTRPED